MNRTKIISRILFLVSRVLAVFYLAAPAYALFCIVAGVGITPYGEGNYLHVNYPFSSAAFMNIDNNPAYIIFSFILPLTLYSIFFWLASGVFKAFLQPRLFVKENIKRLKRFYLFNLIAPAGAVAISYPFVEVENAIWILIIVHFFLAVFAYFLAAIFKQGLHLQNEQDLFI